MAFTLIYVHLVKVFNSFMCFDFFFSRHTDNGQRVWWIVSKKTKAKTIDKKNKLGYKISRPHLFDSSLCLIFWYSTTTRSWSWSISSFTNKQCVMLLFLYLLLLFICDLDKGICAIWTSLYPYIFFSSISFKRVPKVVILQDGKNSIWKVWWFFQFGVL